MSGSILSIARTAIHAHQMAVQVTANNISNAQTPGYTRQRASLVSGTPVQIYPHWLGTGVGVHDVVRVRDQLLDGAVRRDGAQAAGFGIRRDVLAQAEAVLGEPSETGLSAGLDAFWAAWSDLANDPTSGSARVAVQQRGAQVASALNGFDRRLGELADNSVLRFQASVDELNGLLRQVAELNERIVAAEVGGSTAGDLRDARDRAVDEISQIADVRVLQRSNGTYNLVIGGANVVDGNDARELEAHVQNDEFGRPIAFTLTERSQTLGQVGGRLGGLMNAAGDLRQLREQLDVFAAALVERINAVHTRAGEGEEPGPPFFEPGEGRAATIRLSDAIRDDPGAIRAGLPSIGSTDNSIALELAEFRDLRFGGTLGGKSFGEFFRDVAGGVGFKVADAERSTAAAETLAMQALNRRDSMSGVSVDEELILLMRHQQAYTAATRLVNVADEMMQTILRMV